MYIILIPERFSLYILTSSISLLSLFSPIAGEGFTCLDHSMLSKKKSLTHPTNVGCSFPSPMGILWGLQHHIQVSAVCSEDLFSDNFLKVHDPYAWIHHKPLGTQRRHGWPQKELWWAAKETTCCETSPTFFSFMWVCVCFLGLKTTFCLKTL